MLQFPKICLFLSLKIDFVLTNSADTDKMLHYVAFHLCLNCLPNNLQRGSVLKGFN